MPRVIYFELGIKEPEKSLEFYRKVFGWEINRMGKMDYWLASTGERQEPGINGAFIKQTADSQPIVYTIAVGEIDPFLERVVQEGGRSSSPRRASLWWVSPPSVKTAKETASTCSSMRRRPTEGIRCPRTVLSGPH